MDSRQIRCFLAVAEHLSFTKAAHQTCLTHSAVSYQISALERDIGFSLFNRDTHSVCLTPAGKVFSVEAQRAMDVYQSAITKARQWVNGTSGDISIGFLGGFEQGLLPATLTHFWKNFPNIHIRPFLCGFASLREKIVDGSIDVGFHYLDAFEGLPTIHSEPLFEVPLCVIMKPSHPLADREYLAFSDLRSEHLVLLTRAFAGSARKQIDRVWANLDKTPYIAQEADDLATLLLLVEAGIGITLLPRSEASNFSNFKFSCIDILDSKVQGCIAWSEASKNPSVPIFLQEIKAHPPQISPPRSS